MRARRRALAGTARGRVLDLGGADSHRHLWDGAGVSEATVLDGAGDADLSRLVAGGERFDTVVSVFQLASSPDLAATLGVVRALLADDGRLLFVEPGPPASPVRRLIAPPVGGVIEAHPDRDVPMELRAAKLSVIQIQRHRIPTLRPWLRQVVEGVAHHALVPGAGTPSGPA